MKILNVIRSFKIGDSPVKTIKKDTKIKSGQVCRISCCSIMDLSHNATSFLFKPSSSNHIPEDLETYETVVENSKTLQNRGDCKLPSEVCSHADMRTYSFTERESLLLGPSMEVRRLEVDIIVCANTEVLH